MFSQTLAFFDDKQSKEAATICYQQNGPSKPRSDPQAFTDGVKIGGVWGNTLGKFFMIASLRLPWNALVDIIYNSFFSIKYKILQKQSTEKL